MVVYLAAYGRPTEGDTKIATRCHKDLQTLVAKGVLTRIELPRAFNGRVALGESAFDSPFVNVMGDDTNLWTSTNEWAKETLRAEKGDNILLKQLRAPYALRAVSAVDKGQLMLAVDEAQLKEKHPGLNFIAYESSFDCTSRPKRAVEVYEPSKLEATAEKAKA